MMYSLMSKSTNAAISILSLLMFSMRVDSRSMTWLRSVSPVESRVGKTMLVNELSK